MEKVAVGVPELIGILKKNRDAHRGIFEEAQKGYRIKVIELLDQALQDARQGGQINTAFELPVPQDHTSDYDRVIKMLEMSIDTRVELSEDYFAQYVMDDWSWKRQFMLSSAMYLSA